jgi:hypothetical protein
MKLWKITVAGVLFAIISQIIHTVESMATMNFYMDPTYFSVWSKMMMPTAGPPPVEFYIYSLVFSLIAGIIYALIYSMISKSIPGKTVVNKGLYFGFFLFLLSIPSFLTMFMLINLPSLLLLYWSISGFIVYLIFGIVIVKLLG